MAPSMRDDSTKSRPKSSDDHHDAGHRRRLSVFVTAHPDDESMFFVPTIHHLVHQQKKSGSEVWLICLTSGNYDGLGKIRTKELHRTCRNILGMDKVLLIENNNSEDDVLFDDPRQSWDVNQATKCLLKALLDALAEEEEEKEDAAAAAAPFQVIDFITFDELGVSGHINHRDTYRTVKRLCEQLQLQQLLKARKSTSSPPTSTATSTTSNHDLPIRVHGWILETERNIITKYLPIYSWMLLLLSMFFPYLQQFQHDNDNNRTTRIIYRLHQPSLNWKAMRSHASQFVWYRRLFVIFSNYTYVNVLRRMDDEPALLMTQRRARHESQKQQ